MAKYNSIGNHLDENHRILESQLEDLLELNERLIFNKFHNITVTLVEVDITKNFDKKNSPLPFDTEILDQTDSFFLENSTFVAPWKGTFTFSKKNFRKTLASAASTASYSLYGYMNGKIDFVKLLGVGIKD